VKTLAEGRVKFKKVMYRGERDNKPGKTYATDQGDLGAGEYWSSNPSYAKVYGKMKRKTIKLNNPLHLDAKKAMMFFDRYKTVRGKPHVRETGAKRASAYLKSRGYDGVVVKGYEGGKDHVTIVKLK
jgi:hypothetical protein